MSDFPARRLTLRLGDATHVVGVQPAGTDESDGVIELLVDGHRLRARVDAGVVRVEGQGGGPAWIAATGDARWVYHDGRLYELEVQREGSRRRAPEPGSLAAPMPATVRQIRVAVGEQVARGDTLLVLEAMKMELPVKSDADGVVAEILCREGELVQPGRPLIRLGEKS
jgi:acetyl/propionyl-CoA carboxylase alpha subunit